MPRAARSEPVQSLVPKLAALVEAAQPCILPDAACHTAVRQAQVARAH